MQGFKRPSLATIIKPRAVAGRTTRRLVETAMFGRSRIALAAVLAALSLAVAVAPASASDVYVTASRTAFENIGSVAQFSLGAGGALTAKSSALVPAGASASQGVAVSPDGQSVYVTNYSGTVAQFDVGADGALTAKSTPMVSAGVGASAIAVTPDGKTVYVVNETAKTISQYDVGADGALTAAGTVAGPRALGSGSSIAVSPDGQSVYATSRALFQSPLNDFIPGEVMQFDVGAGGALTAKSPARVALPEPGLFPSAVAVSPDGLSVYVFDAQGLVFQLDVGAGGTLTAKSTADVPSPFQGGFGGLQGDVAVSPDGQSVYVTRGGQGRCNQFGACAVDGIAQFDVGADGALTAKSTPMVSAGGMDSSPTRIAMSPDGRNLYVTNMIIDARALFPAGSVMQFDVGADGALTAKSPAEVVSDGRLTDIAVRPTYDFTGFFSPVNNPTDPEPVNGVKAGSSVPVKFSLGGDQGLGVLAENYPNLVFAPCDPSEEADPLEETSAANNGLTFDALTDTYTYVWKTDKGWKGKCATLTVKLDDGTEHTADFVFN
jgi:DNA-binding beta-propeller fold protein YncE